MANPRLKRWLKWGMVAGVVVIFVFAGNYLGKRVNWNPSRSIGQAMDSLDGVPVYYNGGVGQSHGRNTSADGYNVGIRYQCVEFVKRYYLEHYHHKMPDGYGHAKDFFDPGVGDGEMNVARGLRQFRNAGGTIPQVGDLLVWGGSWSNAYGHVAIVSAVDNGAEAKRHEVEYIQQNPGPFGSARDVLPVKWKAGQGYYLLDDGLLGWLRMGY